MKVVIIGGGIAGLTLGIFLRKKNIDAVINERSAGLPGHGHAFLMHEAGLSVLNELAGNNMDALPGKKVDEFCLMRPGGEKIKHLKLTSWKCIKRTDLIRFLYSLFPREKIHEGRTFSHFIYENERVVAAAFLNGEVEYGDIFVGADGGNSKVRDVLFGKVNFTPVIVKEIVGAVCKNKKISKSSPGIFTKYQDKTNGLAFGSIPTSESEFVWFLQYDSTVADVPDSSPEELRSFCFELLKSFPPAVTDILESNDFSTSYVWNTRDFDLLPSFHKQNVVLIGDAAHLALPFTSSGTTNAIVDAKTLAQCLEHSTDYEKAFRKLYDIKISESTLNAEILDRIAEDAVDYEKAFTEFYQLRSAEVSGHTHLGRELKKLFLNPQGYNDDEIPVPLITLSNNTRIAGKDKLIQVLYFTDPICSTCWILQPLLRKLKLEYDNYIHIEYRMGGLLPSWEEYPKGRIGKPSDAAEHWEEVCALHEMPMDGDVWIEDPLSSSYPPSVAFKAAQMQDKDKALVFLRRIKEMVFLEKKNIIKWQFLEKAALDSGLDAARLLRDFDGKAKELFKEDLVLAEQLGVTGFPTLFFSNCSDKKFSLKGFQPYERFEEIIHKLIPTAKKEEINTAPKSLFAHFPTMTNKEFAFLSKISMGDASRILAGLYENGLIDKYQSKNGMIWTSRFAV